MEHAVTSAHEAYRSDLLFALRMREVPAPRIGEVLAEVSSHVAETGEDPREAFGDPREYAEQIAVAVDATPRGAAWGVLRAIGWHSLLGGLLAGGVSGFLLAHSVATLAEGRDHVLGIPALAVAVASAAVLLAWGAQGLRAVWRDNDAVVDPRTGVDLAPVPRWLPTVVVLVPVAGIFALAVAAALSS